MIIVMGTMAFESGEIERLESQFAAHIATTNAEDGCEHYAFSRDVVDVDLMHIAERWRDAAALEAHVKAPHMVVLGEVLGKARLKSASVKSYDGDRVTVMIGE